MTKARERRKAMPRDVTVGDVARLFRQNHSFVLTTHSKPYADGLGSELALHRFLRRIGKISHIVIYAIPLHLFLTMCMIALAFSQYF